MLGRVRQVLDRIPTIWAAVVAALVAFVVVIVLISGGGDGDAGDGASLASCFEQAQELPKGEARDAFLRLCEEGEIEEVDEEQLERERRQALERLEEAGGDPSRAKPADVADALERCRAEAPEEEGIAREIILEECERAARGGR